MLRLVRTADQLVHSAQYDDEGVKQRLSFIDEKCEKLYAQTRYQEEESNSVYGILWTSSNGQRI